MRKTERLLQQPVIKLFFQASWGPEERDCRCVCREGADGTVRYSGCDKGQLPAI